VTVAIFTIRPEPGATATVEAGRTVGLEIERCPLFEVKPLAWSAPAPAHIDALLIGSANAIRHGGAGLEAFRGKPVYAVGSATAKAAGDAGFPVAVTGRGGLQALLDEMSGPLRLIRLAGAEHILLFPPAGIKIETRIAYDTTPLPLSGPAAEWMRGGALVLLHSAAAAWHFAAECDRCGIPRGAIALATLGPRIAKAAGDGWRELREAGEPTEAALLALARDMCHDLQRRSGG